MHKLAALRLLQTWTTNPEEDSAANIHACWDWIRGSTWTRQDWLKLAALRLILILFRQSCHDRFPDCLGSLRMASRSPGRQGQDRVKIESRQGQEHVASPKLPQDGPKEPRQGEARVQTGRSAKTGCPDFEKHRPKTSELLKWFQEISNSDLFGTFQRRCLYNKP